MRVGDDRQSLVAPQSSASATQAAQTNSRWFYGVSITAFGLLLAAIALTAVTWGLLAHTHADNYTDIMSNHLDDDDYDRLTGDTLEADLIRHPDDGDTIVFGGPVVVEGDITFNTTRAEIQAQVVAETITVFEDIFIPDAPDSVTTRSLTETIVGLQEDCQLDDLADLRNETEAFRTQIVSERTDLVECLETNNETLVVLQQSNTVRTTNHTTRLDALSNSTCDAIIAQAVNQTTFLDNFAANLTVVNETNIRTDGKLTDLQGLLANITDIVPFLINASCVYNETTFNTTRQQLIDLRTLLNGTNELLANGTTAHMSCSAVLLNVTLRLDEYETLITNSTTTLDGLNATYVDVQANYTMQLARHVALEMNVTDNNVTLIAFETQYSGCLNDTDALQTRYSELLARYMTLLDEQTTQQGTLTNITNLFNETYTLFNAAADQCDSAQLLYDDLLASYTSLVAQYSANYTAILDVINRSQGITSNLTSLEIAISNLENNMTTYTTIQSSWSVDLDSTNATLIAIDSDITNTVASLDAANATLIDIDARLTALEALVVLQNATLLQLQELVGNQTTTLLDHDTRLDALEAFVCPPTPTILNQIAENYTAAVNITIGDVVSLNGNGEVVLATNMYVKDAYQLDAATFGQDEIRGVNTVPIDSSDHFYSMYKLGTTSISSLTLDGRVYTRDNNMIVKFSPVHEILWVAYTQFTVVPVNNQYGPEILYIEYMPQRNSLFVAGAYVADDEDSQVEFFNADGRSSGLLTPRASPSGSGIQQRPTFWAELSASGEWLNVAMTEHTDLVNQVRTVVNGVTAYGNTALVGFFARSDGSDTTVTLPGGIVVDALASRAHGVFGLFDLTTFNFTYVREILAPPASDSGLITNDVVRNSADEAFVWFEWVDVNTAGTATISVAAVGGGTIVLEMPGANGVNPLRTLVIAKVDISTGDAYWARVSNATTDDISHTNLGGANNYFFQPRAELVVDHFDRVWVALIYRGTGATVGLDAFTYDGVTQTFDPADQHAVLLLRINPRNGNVLDMNAYGYQVLGGMIENDRFEVTTFMTDDIGDPFLAVVFAGESLVIEDTVYNCPSQTCTAVLKYKADLPPAINLQYVYFDDYSETAFTIDSHGNIWSFLHENVNLPGDVDSIVTDGIGIVKLGQHDLEPFGVAAESVLAGQSVRVVHSGELIYPAPHGFASGQNLFNDHGALTSQDVYGKTRIGITASPDKLIVDMHRARITQQLR